MGEEVAADTSVHEHGSDEKSEVSLTCRCHVTQLVTTSWVTWHQHLASGHLSGGGERCAVLPKLWHYTKWTHTHYKCGLSCNIGPCVYIYVDGHMHEENRSCWCDWTPSLLQVSSSINRSKREVTVTATSCTELRLLGNSPTWWQLFGSAPCCSAVPLKETDGLWGHSLCQT